MEHPMEPQRVLKKYGNRRLYDTVASSYVTLAEVEQMIQRGEDVMVVDAKSGEDLTRAVLTQIICEREQSRDVLPLAFLKQVIRTGASPETAARFTDHLLGSLRGFADAQRAFLQANPFFNPFAFGGPGPQPPQRVEAPPPQAIYNAGGASRAELDELKAELKATQAVLRELVHGQHEQREPPPAPRAKRAPKKKARG